MVITSKNNSRSLRYGSNQIRFAVFYIALTAFTLLFLNIYTSQISQRVFFRNEQAAVQDKLLLITTALGQQESLDSDSAAALGKQDLARMLITDGAGCTVYDSLGIQRSKTVCQFPEVQRSLRGIETVNVDYQDGVLVTAAAAPIMQGDSLVGAVYILEQDPEQGALIRSLNINILIVTALLIIFISIFSCLTARLFNWRLRQIMDSIRIIREGNYAHKVSMNGSDELSALGREFNALTDKLLRSEEQRRQFVSDASHELKTPLASIKLLSDSILQNDMDVDTVREFVADIGDEADRLTRMSEKLLSLTRFHPDEGSDCEITYFRPTIERVLRMLSTAADMACVTLAMDIRDDSSILILEDDLYQIIFNLVENGIKYNVPDGSLTVGLRRREDNAVLTVSDTGMGIPPESLDRIFDRFYRVDKARSRQTGGSGLGLSIVREMVERNRGTITVTSSHTPPTGTTFTLTFPIFDVEEDI